MGTIVLKLNSHHHAFLSLIGELGGDELSIILCMGITTASKVLLRPGVVMWSMIYSPGRRVSPGLGGLI